MNAKRLIFLNAVLAFSCGHLLAQQGGGGSKNSLAESQVTAEPIPASVVTSAVAAVAKLGDEVVLGRYQVAVDRMNPMWKERVAKRMGGMENLEKKLAGVSAQMVKQGVKMISFKPQGKPQAYEVYPGKKVVRKNGADVEKLVYTKWMVLVPTSSRFRIMREGVPKPLVIDSSSFQVAICDKGKNDWTFIDGASITVNDLRGLFLTLSTNVELPKIEKHEVR